MSKYIIELKDDVQVVQKVGVTENGNAFVMNFYKDQLEELTSDYIKEHFGQLQDDAYQKGFEDGKAVNDKGCEGCKYSDGAVQENSLCFNCSNYYTNNWTAKNDKVEVGDEVIYNGTTKCVVVTPETDEKYASLFDCNGIHYSADHRECKKTGRRFDIKSILEAMKHD